MTLYPRRSADAGCRRHERREAARRSPKRQTILKIPALPISYADAQVLLKAIGGQVAPASWRGSLPITYRVGPGTAQRSSRRQIGLEPEAVYDVIATMKGSTYPDQWVRARQSS